MSRSLKELEELLGTPLFDRVGRGLRLNETGRVFQAHAAAAMIELMRGRDRLGPAGAAQVVLSIGVLPTAASELVPRAALAFLAEAPQVRLHIQSGPNGLLYSQLRDGAVDLVVGRMPESGLGSAVTFEQLYIEEVTLVCRPGHPILSAARPEALLAAYPLVLPPPGAVIAPTVERYLSSLGLPAMKGAVETVALPVGRRIVQASDMLWFISRGVVAAELAQGTLAVLDLASPLLSGPVGISMSRSAPLSVERKLLADCLRAAARRSGDGHGRTQNPG